MKRSNILQTSAGKDDVMIIENATDFWLFIAGIGVAGAVFLGIMWKIINKIVKRK